MTDESGELLALDVCPGLFIEALVLDQIGYLVFASLWGRDTACQEFLAKLSLPATQGGITAFAAGALRASVRSDRLEKLTGRVPRECLFGNVVQLMLFDPLCKEPDLASRRAILLFQSNEAENHDRLWTLVRSVCHLPLLDHWRAVLDAFVANGWIEWLPAFGRVQGCMIDLGETAAIEALIHDMALAGVLRLQ